MVTLTAGAFHLGSGGVSLRRLLHERDHVGHALRSIGAEMLGEFERSEAFGDVETGNLRRGLVLYGAEDERHDALRDRGVAVGEEMEPAVQRGRIDPDGCRAAPN